MVHQEIRRKPIESNSFTILMMALAVAVVLACVLMLKNLALVGLLYHFLLCMVFPVVQIAVIRKRGFLGYCRTIGLDTAGIRGQLVWGFAHGAVAFAGILGGIYLVRRGLDFSAISGVLVSWGVASGSRWLMVALMVLFNGLAEELFWRGWALGRLGRAMNRWVAILLADIFYTSYHLATVFSFFTPGWAPVALVAAIFMGGLFWGWLRLMKGLWAPVIGHMLVTLGYMLVYVFYA